MPAEVKKTVRRKLRTVPIQMLFPCADVLIDNSGLVAGMTELSRHVIFRVVPLEEVMLVFSGVDQENFREEGSVSGTWRRDEHPRHHQVSVLENDAENSVAFYLSINIENFLCLDEIRNRALCIRADVSSLI